MATSGSVDYAVSRDDIITEALQICGVIPEGGSPTANQLSDCSRTLNMMVKNIQAKPEYNLWTITRGVLFPAHDQIKYILGGASANHNCNLTDFVYTTIRTNYASGTTLEVTSTTGMTAADAIGVVLDDGTLEWTTIAGGGVVDADTLTLTAGFSSAATAGNLVYTYTSKINRPLRIMSAYSRDMTALTDTAITIISRQEHDNYSTKYNESTMVNQLYYDPQLGEGHAWLWPEPSNMNNVIVFNYTRPLEDFDAAGNNPDFPQEWYLPLTWNLASMLSLKYSVPVAERRDITALAQMYLADALNFDREGNTSIFVGLAENGD